MPTRLDITIIVPSKVEQNLENAFPGLPIISPVQTFKKYEELHYTYCAAIQKVTTKFFHFYDDDDPVPSFPQNFPDTGIIFGDNFFIYNGTTKRYDMGAWSFDKHFKHPQLIHRAICRTEDARRILAPVTHLPIVPDWWLYAHLAKESGYYYDAEMLAYWDAKPTGLHTKTHDAFVFTRQLFRKTYPELFK